MGIGDEVWRAWGHQNKGSETEIRAKRIHGKGKRLGKPGKASGKKNEDEGKKEEGKVVEE